MKFQDEVLALLKLRTERGEPRRNLKRLLRDHGGDGSAEELDAVFDSDGYGSQKVADLAEKLRVEQESEAGAIESGMAAGVAAIFAQLNAEMKSQGKANRIYRSWLTSLNPKFRYGFVGKETRRLDMWFESPNRLGSRSFWTTLKGDGK